MGWIWMKTFFFGLDPLPEKRREVGCQLLKVNKCCFSFGARRSADVFGVAGQGATLGVGGREVFCCVYSTWEELGRKAGFSGK